MTPAKTIKSRLAFEQAVKAILESYAGEPISFPKGVWPVQFEKVAKQITKLHMSELANLLVEAKARTTHAGEHMMLSQLAKEVSRKKRPAPSLGSRLAKAAKPQCHHEGDKSDFHPQFCRKCGEEFAYVHPYLLPVSPDK